ncbi:MAG: hypothetical protein V4725_09655 [Bacteroidota bacterium]
MAKRCRLNVYLKVVKVYFEHAVWFSILLLLCCSCQKELYFETVAIAQATLVKNARGECTPVSFKGTYNVGSSLTDSNRVSVNIHLPNAGNVKIHSDTVNGYFFSYAGVLTDTGIVSIQLKGYGKPIKAGVDVFVVRLGTSECTTSITVGDPSFPASYSLSGSGSRCMSDSVYGVYTSGTLTDTSNRIAVQLNVVKPGSYTIRTDTVNGYSFSGKGILPNKGIQTVFLQASGTPLQVGTNTFRVKADSSFCSLTVNVLLTQAVTSADLFPLTFKSNWNYTGNVFPVATARSITDSLVVDSDLYKKMHEALTPGPAQDFLFRKQGDNYYEYGNAEKYTSTITFNPAVTGNILFLKENMQAGNHWYSDLYTGHATFGQDVNLQYHFTCLEADVSVVIDGKAFVHVYKVSLVPQLAAVRLPPGDTHEKFVFWYAKGIGLIYSTFSSFKIDNWVVY